MEEKLPKAFKTKWVEALRSGDYKQGEGLLYNDIGKTYCCLGVACKISEPDYVPPYDEFIRGSKRDKIYPNLPAILVGEDNIPKKLADMNDGAKLPNGEVIHPKMSFVEIADWIEKHL